MVGIPNRRSLPARLWESSSPAPAAARNVPGPSIDPADRPGTSCTPCRRSTSGGGEPVDPGRPCTLVTRDPVPRHHQRTPGHDTRLNRSSNRRPGSATAQRCSLVCIRQYPRRRLDHSSDHGHAGIHRRSPASQSPPLPSRWPPFAMWPAFPASEYYGRLRPTPARIGRRRTYPTAQLAATGSGPPGWFPRSLLSGRRDRRPAMPLRHRRGYAADLHHGLPASDITRPRSSHRTASVRVRTATRPRSARFEPVDLLRGFTTAGSSRTPLRLARRTRTIWQCWPVPALSGLLPPSPGVPGIRLPSASPGPLRRAGGGVLSSPHGQKAPRGARCPTTTPGTERRRAVPVLPSPDVLPVCAFRGSARPTWQSGTSSTSSTDSPFVQFTGPDLPDRQIRVLTGVDQRQHRGPLHLGQCLTAVGHHPSFLRTMHRPGTVPVATGPGPADQRARGLGGPLRTAKVRERRGQRVVGGGGVSVLSEMVSKSP